MIILDKKSYELLFYIVGLTEPETIMTISKQLKQSRRKVYYHLEKINEALPKDCEQIISYPRVGIILTPEQKKACHELIADLDDYSYVMSVQERIQLTLTYIAVAKKRITIEKLMKLNDVSRNTVLNDLNEIRIMLSEQGFDITLQVSKARGYYLQCHPLTRIQYLYRLLYHTYTEGNASFIEIVKDKIVDLTGFDNYFSEEINQYLTKALASAQKKLGKKINLQDSQFMIHILPFLLLSYRSIELTEAEREIVRQDFNLTRKRIEFRLARQIAADLTKQFGIELDDIEVSLISMLLLSSRKYRDLHLASKDYEDMRATLDKFLQTICTTYGLQFYHYQDLLNHLLMHCKSLVYRKTYGVLSVNPLLKYIKEQYIDLFNMTKSCVFVLEEAWMIKLTDDDIAYLTIHLGGDLEKETLLTRHLKRAVIVCDEGIGVQKLLLNQCNRCLKDYQIEAVFTSEQFHSVSDIMKTDIVISTTDHISSPFPTIVIQPILCHEEIIRLVAFAKTQVLHSETGFYEELEAVLQPYVPDVKERFALKAKIEKIIGQELIR
ncbi:transcription antiterminator [Tuanshanicoccus lijuaniae]|uniref:BglG family transcription antiterminator n=1 Tax=Aerococcaceae bacterium zg-1292 TaxID=2774330 RepID=UPI0019389A40|nr:transcription antiterminator [Aerococcaceae bacterium zg-1292]MBS4456510.1 transcription antiterminator [Aerococcaceae bacterium zg-A91]MBS4458611.1 transcription antiterminator [Aerococcaceae bacterium zg-BR33]QQA36384.1 transcription antiterminator [Aerococcaceae bacterium zg-1292]